MSRMSNDQLVKMLEFMEQNPDLAKGKCTAKTRHKSKKKWSELSEILNALQCDYNGAKKTPEKWSKAWSDYKLKVKNKMYLQACNDGEMNEDVELSQLEKKVADLVDIKVDPNDVEFVTELRDCSDNDDEEPHKEAISVSPARTKSPPMLKIETNGIGEIQRKRLKRKCRELSSDKETMSKSECATFIREMEQRRIEAETIMAHSQRINAEAALKAAEASKEMAEASRQQAVALQSIADTFRNFTEQIVQVLKERTT